MLSIKRLMLAGFVALYSLGILGIASASGPIDTGSEAAPLNEKPLDHLRLPMSQDHHYLKGNAPGAR